MKAKKIEELSREELESFLSRNSRMIKLAVWNQVNIPQKGNAPDFAELKKTLLELWKEFHQDPEDAEWEDVQETLAKAAEEEAKAKAEKEAKPKRKRGRPKKSETEKKTEEKPVQTESTNAQELSMIPKILELSTATSQDMRSVFSKINELDKSHRALADKIDRAMAKIDEFLARIDKMENKILTIVMSVLEQIEGESDDDEDEEVE